MGMISCGSGPELKDEFSIPFVESANYLGMNYLRNVHTWLENDTEITEEVKTNILNFTSKLIHYFSSSITKHNTFIKKLLNLFIQEFFIYSFSFTILKYCF